MKYFFLILFLLFSAAEIFASQDACTEYAYKAISCLELDGDLASSYDEEGSCGENKSIWIIKGSSNPSIGVSENRSRHYTYMGGEAWEYDCSVSFIDFSKREKCNFDMLVSLGTEDGDIKVSDFKCHPIKSSK
jgi:hypothetical protein